jgi:hypothetical protein
MTTAKKGNKALSVQLIKAINQGQVSEASPVMLQPFSQHSEGNDFHPETLQFLCGKLHD